MIDRNVNLAEKKRTILDMIRKEGPCIPSTLANRIGIPLLLTSALFSEMKTENMLKLSNLKIGGSPLYYVEGQEAMLENFTKHLELKEREAFELLKKEEIVDEEKMEPAHRVAFRNMKDFAFPIQVKTESGDKIFWRFHSVKPETASEKISELLKKYEKKPEEARGHEGAISHKEEIKEEKKPEEKAEEKKEEKQEEKHKERKTRKPKDREKTKNKVGEWLHSKGLIIEKDFDDEISCVVSASSQVGKLHFLVVTKLKKSIGEADLSLAYQQGQSEKMPVLLLTNGSLTKKAQVYLEQLGRFIVVEKL